jgi:subtilisin family serine protease
MSLRFSEAKDAKRSQRPLRRAAFCFTTAAAFGFLAILSTVRTAPAEETPPPLDCGPLKQLQKPEDAAKKKKVPPIQCNLTAQWLHRVDDLRVKYRLSGAGVTVGLWEAADPGPYAQVNHEEFFGGRVGVGSPESTVGLHATHVAGTIGATGVNPLLQGMAPDARVSSWSTAELTDENVGAVSVGNHSWGQLAGWFTKLRFNKCFLNDKEVPWPKYNKVTKTWESRYVPVWYGTDLFGTYNVHAALFDAQIFKRPEHSAFVAAGNDRGEDPRLKPFWPDPAKAQQHYCLQAVDPKDPKKKRLEWVKRVPELADGRNTDYQVAHKVVGYRTIPGMASAKNVITVGAVKLGKSGLQVTTFTNYGPVGPVEAGRIKPDVVAFGDFLLSTVAPERCKDEKKKCNQTNIAPAERAKMTAYPGTSMATPIATGVGALLNQLSNRLFKRPLCADEMKAVLVHTARPLPRIQVPSYQAGWGAIDALRAGQVVAGDEGRIFSVWLDKDATVPLAWSNRRAGRITAAWIDTVSDGDISKNEKGEGVVRPGAQRLLEKIDIRLRSPAGSGTVYPWSLDPDKPASAPRNDRTNGVDNVQRIDVDSGQWESGTWSLMLERKHPIVKSLRVSIVVTGFEPAESSAVAAQCKGTTAP